MRKSERFSAETNTGKCSGKIQQKLKTAIKKSFSDSSLENDEDLQEICDNFRIIERQRNLYWERCIRLQKENEDLKRMLDKIQNMVCGS